MRAAIRRASLAYYSGRGSLGGWLRAVVSQLAIDEFRKQSKFVQIEEDREFDNLASGADGSNGIHATAAAADNPEELLTAARGRFGRLVGTVDGDQCYGGRGQARS